MDRGIRLFCKISNNPIFLFILFVLGFLGFGIGIIFMIDGLVCTSAFALIFSIMAAAALQSEQNEIVRAEYDTEKEMMTITLRSGESIVYSRSKSTWYKMPDYDRVEGKEKLQLLRFYDYNKKFGVYYKK